MYIIKRRDPEGLIYFTDTLVDCTTDEEFCNTITSFFIANAENITPDDVAFFEITSNEFINTQQLKRKKTKKKKEQKEDVDMRKIQKAVALFEKNGLELGKDYSFRNGKIRMTKESQEKITKLLGN
jgi:polygalacturonase